MATTSPRMFTRPSRRQLIAIVLAVAVAAGIGATVRPAHAAEAPVDLRTADGYGVLGAQTVTNTGPTVIGGDLGVSPLMSITGFPPGIVGGATHAGDAPAAQAQLDLTAAFLDAGSRAPTASSNGSIDLGGQNVLPGVYSYAGSIGITGNLTLTGDANSVWIFRTGSTLITVPNSTVTLNGPINPCNVFWKVDSSATLGTNSTMVGTVMTLTSIDAATGARISGRLLAQTGGVTLDSNSITGPLSCSAAPPATAVPGQATFTG